MKVKNTTSITQNVGGVIILPWRYAEIPDGTEIDEKLIEIVGEKKPSKKIRKSSAVFGDLDGDGDFDKDDKSIAGKVLAKKIK